MTDIRENGEARPELEDIGPKAPKNRVICSFPREKRLPENQPNKTLPFRRKAPKLTSP